MIKKTEICITRNMSIKLSQDIVIFDPIYFLARQVFSSFIISLFSGIHSTDLSPLSYKDKMP